MQCTYATIKIFENILIVEGARLEKGLQISPFSKMSKPNSLFLNIFQIFLQKLTPRTLLPYFDTKHSISICEIFIFLLYVYMGGGGKPRIFLIISKPYFNSGL